MQNTITNMRNLFSLRIQKMSLSLLLLLTVAFGCKTTETTTNNSLEKQVEKVIPKREHTVQSLLWQQNAAEYKALCYQAYNIAQFRLEKFTQHQYKRPIAVVTDIDETVLDNSPYNARMIKNDKGFTKETWYAWGNESSAKPVPGALEFFKYAHSKGVTVFYLSNRDEIQKEATIKNLQKLGFPGVDAAHVLLRNGSSAKKPRRDLINNTHQIVLLFGDNLSDFSELFDKQPTEKRNKLVNDLKMEFGKRFIVLPNPMYGDWESKGIYEGNYNWTAEQKDSIRKAKLRIN